MEFRLDEEQLGCRTPSPASARTASRASGRAARGRGRRPRRTWRALADLGVFSRGPADERGRTRASASSRQRSSSSSSARTSSAGPLLWSTLAASVARRRCRRRAARRRRRAVRHAGRSDPRRARRRDRRAARPPRRWRVRLRGSRPALVRAGRRRSIRSRRSGAADVLPRGSARRRRTRRGRRCGLAGTVLDAPPCSLGVVRGRARIVARATRSSASSSASRSARSRPSSTCSPTCTSAPSWPAARPTRRPPSLDDPGIGDPVRAGAAAKLLAGEAGARERTHRDPGARRHGLHLGHAAALPAQARLGARARLRRRRCARAGARHRDRGQSRHERHRTLPKASRSRADDGVLRITLDRRAQELARPRRGAAHRRGARGRRHRRLAAGRSSSPATAPTSARAPTGWRPTPRRRTATADRAASSGARRCRRTASIELLATIQLPVVCAVRGWAAGLGCQLALAADFTVAAETAASGSRSSSAASAPTAAPTWLLPRLVGVARAKELLLLGRELSGAEAAAWGLIHRAVPDDELDAATDDARRAARRRGRPSPSGSPSSASTARSSAGSSTRWQTEAFALELSSRTADFKEGLLAFQERRPARVRRAGERRDCRWTSRRSSTRSTTASRRSRSNRPDRLNALSPLDGRASCAQAYAAAEADDDVWIAPRHRQRAARSAPAPTSTEIPDDGRVIYDEPYLSTLPAVGGAAGGHAAVPHR